PSAQAKGVSASTGRFVLALSQSGSAVFRLIPRTVAATQLSPPACRSLPWNAPPLYKYQWLLSTNMRIGRPPRLSGVPRRHLRACHVPTIRLALLPGEAGGGAVELNSASARGYAQCQAKIGKPSSRRHYSA